MQLREALNRCPLIAILRGILPDQSEDVARILVENGFRVLEVPLNSPDALESIARMVRAVGDRALVGAGTVLDPQSCEDLAAIGARISVSPNMNPSVIRAAKRNGLISLPGVATPSEAFAALDAGADGLKMFPAETLGPKVVRAWRAVLPDGVILIPVGGITTETMQAYSLAGAAGFGIGSALFKPQTGLQELRGHAADFSDQATRLK